MLGHAAGPYDLRPIIILIGKRCCLIEGAVVSLFEEALQAHPIILLLLGISGTLLGNIFLRCISFVFI